MDCKEFERLIPDFLDDKLNLESIEEFYKHKETCADCREELEISYLVSMGLNRLEDGDSFDLKKELNYFFEHIEKKLKRHRIIFNIFRGIEGLLTICVIGFIWWIMD